MQYNSPHTASSEGLNTIIFLPSYTDVISHEHSVPAVWLACFIHRVFSLYYLFPLFASECRKRSLKAQHIRAQSRKMNPICERQRCHLMLHFYVHTIVFLWFKLWKVAQAQVATCMQSCKTNSWEGPLLHMSRSSNSFLKPGEVHGTRWKHLELVTVVGLKWSGRAGEKDQ